MHFNLKIILQGEKACSCILQGICETRVIGYYQNISVSLHMHVINESGK